MKKMAAGLMLGLSLALSLGMLQGCGGGGRESAAAGIEARLTASSGALAGEPVMLDATASVLPSGAVSYLWRVNAPDGSAAVVYDAASAKPYFLPAVAGTYQVLLAITVASPPYAVSSPVATLNVDVQALVPPTAAQARARLLALASAASPMLPPDSTSPVITVGLPGAGSNITESRLLGWNRPEFIYAGAVEQAGGVYPDYLFGTNRAVSYAAAQSSGSFLSIDFVTDAIEFEILQKGLGYNSRMRVVVDGRLASATPTQLPADGALYLTHVRFANKAVRHIRLLGTSPYFGGIRLGPADAVSRPAAGTRLRTLFFGDSITESAAGQDAAASYAPRSAELLGWADAWVSGVGFTGYLAAPSPKLTLRQRFAADVKRFTPAVLVVAAGVNDTTFTDGAVQAEAALLFDQIQADLPDTLVFVMGPLATTNRVRPGINSALKAAVGSRSNFYWVPNVDEAWLTGTGNAGSPAGNGNADIYISADVTHPTPAGIEYLAGKLNSFIRQAVR